MPHEEVAPLLLFSRRNLTIAFAFCALLLVVYYPALHSPFFFDDFPAIVDNTSIRSLGSLDQILAPPRFTPVAGRPLVNVSFALNFAASKLEPELWHLSNAVIHLTNLGLMCGLVFSCSAVVSRKLAVSEATWFAVSCSAILLWGIHPIVSESIVYTTQRSELLCATFMLMALICGIHYCNRGNWKSLGVCIATSICAVLCKESGVLLCVVFALMFPVVIDNEQKDKWRKWFTVCIGMAFNIALFVWILTTAPRTDSVGFDLGIDAGEYLVTQSRVIMEYVWQVFYPNRLCIDYGADLYSIRDAWWSLLVVSLSFIAIVVLYRKSPLCGLLPLLCFVLLAPTSSFIPIVSEIGAERRVYLPSSLLILWATWVIVSFLKSIPRHAVRMVLAVSWIVLFGSCSLATMERCKVYHTTVELYSDAVAKRPTNFRAWFNLGTALRDQGNFAGAITAFESGLRVMQHDRLMQKCRALMLLAASKAELGESASAIRPLVQEAILCDYYDSKAWAFGAKALQECGVPEEASRLLRRAIYLHGDRRDHICLAYAETSYALGRKWLAAKYLPVLSADEIERGSEWPESVRVILQDSTIRRRLLLSWELGKKLPIEFNSILTLLRQGEINLAKRKYLALPKANVGSTLRASFEGDYHRMNGNIALSARWYQKAIEIDRENVDAMIGLAALTGKAEPQKAMQLLQQAIILDPDSAEAKSNLGNMLVRSGKIDDAIRAYQDALEVNPLMEAARKNLRAISEMSRNRE